MKTEKGAVKGKISFYCETLKVSREGFYEYLRNLGKPYKYCALAVEMRKIVDRDVFNDTYGYVRMHQALTLKKEQGEIGPDINIPCERTVYRIMEHEGLVHAPKRKPNGITKEDREARKSDDLLKRDFTAERPCEKLVTDITELAAADGKLYLSGIEDCYDNAVLAICMEDNMRARLTAATLEAAAAAYPEIKINNAVCHSDRGSQYTSKGYREAAKKCGIRQSMNSAGGRCHDNAKCESLWARFKEEAIYGRVDTLKMTTEELKAYIWRYFMGYWNNRRICSANGGLPPMVKRERYYHTH